MEVTCAVDGCGWAWWLDALDPTLPDGPFLCADHGGPKSPPGPWPKATGDGDMERLRAKIASMSGDELRDLWERLQEVGDE